MLLSDREIQAALQRGVLRITPTPTEINSRWASTAVDLTLDAPLQLWKPLTGTGTFTKVVPHDTNSFNATALAKQCTDPCDCTNGFVVKPGAFLLAWTAEKIQLPHTSRLAARVEGKSSLARIGLGVHVTAPTIHAGFGYRSNDPDYPGLPIQLEMWNIGPLEIEIKKKEWPSAN